MQTKVKDQARVAPDSEKVSSRSNLSTAQEVALQALLEADSITSAAAHANVTRQTVAKWLRKSRRFQKAFDAGSADLRDCILSRAAAFMELATRTLVDEMKDGVDSRSRVAAARIMGDWFKGLGLAESQRDLERRILLEQQPAPPNPTF